MWLLVCLVGILFSSFFCWKMWLKYESSPVFTSLDSPRFPLNDNPFPAVTVCGVNKVSDKRLRLALSDPRYGITVWIPFKETSQILFFSCKVQQRFLQHHSQDVKVHDETGPCNQTRARSRTIEWLLQIGKHNSDRIVWAAQKGKNCSTRLNKGVKQLFFSSKLVYLLTDCSKLSWFRLGLHLARGPW